jgi:hypothetical protein
MEFTFLGQLYRLTSISLILDSTLDARYHFYAWDQGPFEDSAIGAVGTTHLTVMPSETTIPGLTYTTMAVEDQYLIDTWSLLPIYTEVDYSVTRSTAVSTALTTTDPSALAYFTSHYTIDFFLAKQMSLYIYNWYDQPQFKALESDVNDWHGTADLRFTYDPVPAPEAASVLLAGAGLGLIALGARFRKR